MPMLRTEEGDRIRMTTIEVTEAGQVVAEIDVITSREPEVRIVVRRIENDPTIVFTVV